tara:strand:+ start:3359 stop:4129 length:771 start_codon:yes stop_codon:yes gene_type:complete
MSYLGGKAKCARHIIDALNDPLFDDMDYVEPFVGYAHVLRRVKDKATYQASDANPLLITLLVAIQEKRPLPRVHSREEYRALHRDALADPLHRATAAFTYSFNGKEWGGYVSTYTRRDGRVDDIPASRRRYYDKLAANDAFLKTTIRRESYVDLSPVNCLVYCDPPYESTTGFKTDQKWNADAFWEMMRSWSADNVVFVSEYAAPDDFRCVASAKKMSCVAGGANQSERTEKLFVHQSALSRTQFATTATSEVAGA